MTAIRIGPPAPHSHCWWAYDLAWANLQRDNHRRWMAKRELVHSVAPEHYAFLSNDRARSAVAPAAVLAGL